MHKIILASQSPRRRQILENLEIPIEVIPSEIDENLDLDVSPYECVKTLSEKKAYAVLDKVKEQAVIMGVDTIVADMGKILTKPTNREDAIRMLSHLQGRRHTVYTGVTMLFVDEKGEVYDKEHIIDGTEVRFNTMSKDEIDAYLGTQEYTDKAGAYAIQGKAAIFVDGILGNFDNVVGLPVPLVYQSLKKRGINLMDYWK